VSAPKNQAGGKVLSQQYDKVVVLVVLVLLIAASITLSLMAGAKKAALKEDGWKRPPANPAAVAPLDTQLVASIRAAIQSPLQIAQEQRRLAVGELRVSCVPNGHPIAYDATNCAVCQAPQPRDDEDRDSDGDGMSDKAEMKYGFNALDPSDAIGDSDDDGFNNVEEVTALTDPKNKDSRPDPSTKLRVAKINIEPFKIRFQGIQKLPDGDRYQLNLRSLDRTYFAKVGDTNGVEGYKVLSFDGKDPKAPALVLQDPDGRQIRLVQGKVIDEDSFSAILVSLLDRKPFKVAIKGTFKLGETTYNVVDISRERVVIRAAKDGRDTTVPPLKEDERMRLMGVGDPIGAGIPDAMRRPGAPASPADPLQSILGPLQ
jgi:hypothetical protein